MTEMKDLRFDINELFDISNEIALYVIAKYFPEQGNIDEKFIEVISMMDRFNDHDGQIKCLMVATKKHFDEIVKDFIINNDSKTNCWEMLNEIMKEYGEQK